MFLGAGWKPYFIIHLRLIEMKIGTLLDIGHNSAANVKIVVEDCIQMGDLAISFIDPQSACNFFEASSPGHASGVLPATKSKTIAGRPR